MINESSRREILLKNGRITEATIIDGETLDTGEEIVYYYYNIQGVDFESSDILTDEQKDTPIKYAPGAKVSIDTIIREITGIVFWIDEKPEKD